jgi:hypothetical protein
LANSEVLDVVDVVLVDVKNKQVEMWTAFLSCFDPFAVLNLNFFFICYPLKTATSGLILSFTHFGGD